LFTNYNDHLSLNRFNSDKNSDEEKASMFSSLKSKFFNQINKITNDSVEAQNLPKSKSTNKLPTENQQLNLQKRKISSDSFKKSNRGNEATGRNILKVLKAGQSVASSVDAVQTKELDKNISDCNSPDRSVPDSPYDSYHSEKILAVEEKRKIKKYNFFGYNKNKEQSMTAVYRRIVDINTLENKIFKNNKRQEKIENNNISELLFNLQKKL